MSTSQDKSIFNHPAYKAVVNELALKAEENRSLVEEVARLKRDLAAFRKVIFGKKSERV